MESNELVRDVAFEMLKHPDGAKMLALIAIVAIVCFTLVAKQSKPWEFKRRTRKVSGEFKAKDSER